MLLHNKIAYSEANGPGARAVVYFQGCTLGCLGCWNPETHVFDTSKEVPTDDIIDWIAGLPEIEGVTFSGGEPLQHPVDLFLIMWELRRRRPELSFGMYTGYTLRELDRGDFRWFANGSLIDGDPQIWAMIRHLLDFAIMGRYNQEKTTSSKPMCGSDNQQVQFFSERYSLEDLGAQVVEFSVDPSGLVQLTGFPVGLDVDELVKG